MSNQIEKHYRVAFKQGIDSAVQQMDTKLRPFVDMVRQEAEFDYYDRVGMADDLNEVTTRYGTNPHSEIPHDRRQVALRDFDQGKMIDEKDLARVANDPTNAYTQALLGAAHRKVDDIIIAGFTADAKIGKTGSSSVSFVSTTSGKISVGAVSDVQSRITAGTYWARTASVEGIDIAKDYTGAAAADKGLTIAKLRGIRQAMMKIDALGQDEVLNMFCATQQFEDLLGEDKIINGDYSLRRRLENGEVTEWGGFRFIHVERLPLASGVRSCFAFKSKAVKLAVGTDVTADMWRLPDRKNIPYLYIKLGMGATRMWGEYIARVNCVE